MYLQLLAKLKHTYKEIYKCVNDAYNISLKQNNKIKFYRYVFHGRYFEWGHYQDEYC